MSEQGISVVSRPHLHSTDVTPLHGPHAPLWHFFWHWCRSSAFQHHQNYCFQFLLLVLILITILESSQSLHTSAKATLFARWQHHLQFRSGFPYALWKAMLTKISKWSRIQDSFRITPKIESLVVCAIPDIPSRFQKDPPITFWVILLTHRQTDKQTKSGKNITSLAEVIIVTNVANVIILQLAYHE